MSGIDCVEEFVDNDDVSREGCLEDESAYLGVAYLRTIEVAYLRTEFITKLRIY
jgi:hypothetical protein